MSTKKSKVKASRKHVRKPAARKVNRKVAKPAAPKVDLYAEACNSGKPIVAHVSVGGDRLPVQIKDAAHIAKLREEHGAACVEVQGEVAERTGKYA